MGTFPERAEERKRMTSKNITTMMYRSANETDFVTFANQAILNFRNRVVNIYNFIDSNIAKKTKEGIDNSEYIKKTLYSTDFYKVFDKAGTLIYHHDPEMANLFFPTFDFKINSKNINFETTLNLREKIIILNKPNLDESIGNIIGDQIFCIKDIPNWQDLFGKGEFPYMTIYVFRLGNTEYFAYDIHR